MIVHGRRANPTDPKVFEVIDGQQRLTTCFLFVAALVKTLSTNNLKDEAAKLAQNYLQIGRVHRRSNLRIHSSRLDRAMMRAVIDDIKQDDGFVEMLKPYDLVALPAYGANRGALRNNYNRFKRFLGDKFESGGIEKIRQIYEVFLNSFTVVQIDVLDPTDGPKIFDSLNSKQEPMRIGDLVRNEIFRKIADETPERSEAVDEEVWQPFYASFDINGINYFEKYLFPYGLVSDPNLTKSDVFIKLRSQWNDIAEPSKIVESLDRYKGPYLDTICGTNTSSFNEPLARRYTQLAAMGAPSSVLPFTMQLGRAVVDGKVAEGEAICALDAIQSFLVRRAIAGHEPTGLHAVFKRLWADLNMDVSVKAISSAISGHKTVAWPDRNEIRRSIFERHLYQAAITPYLLNEYDKSLGGDAHDDIETTEHVLPQGADLAWKKAYGEEFFERDLHALPNLLPCSGSMNSSLSNQPYLEKRARFAKDSKFKSVRQFAECYQEWNHEKFIERGELMYEWILQRWPHESKKI